MDINSMRKDKKMSIYRLSKISGVPYATVNDICNVKTSLTKCSGETIYRLAQTLEVSMEDLLAPYLVKRADFENFKSAVCHRLKEKSDINFIIDVLESNEIRTYYDRKWYPECLYLLAMLDYVSRENNVPLCSDYDDLRSLRLRKTLYPAGIKAQAVASHSDIAMKQAVQNSIPEFIRFNIVENEVRNVA